MTKSNAAKKEIEMDQVLAQNTNTANVPSLIVKKMEKIEAELNDIFVERENVIRDLLIAVVSKQHLLLLGPPGTGKSELSYAMLSHISDGMFFSWLLNKTSDPAEILGPYSFKAMEHDSFLRKADGLLPEADIAFIDEIFKCNSATLNALLSILNERIFYNDGKKTPVPLSTMIAASNEGPEDESLAALYDRLIFRHKVDYIKEPGNVAKVWENDINKRAGKNNGKHKTTITLDELSLLQDEVARVDFPKGMVKALNKLKVSLHSKDIACSDRRWVVAIQVMQTSALLNGRNSVKPVDLRALKAILWERDSDIAIIDSMIETMVDPYESELKKLIGNANEIISYTMAISDLAERAREAIEAKTKLEIMSERIDEIIVEANQAGFGGDHISSYGPEIENLTNEFISKAVFHNKRPSRQRVKTDDELQF